MRADLDNLVGNLVSRVLVGLPNMPPKLLVAVFSFDSFTGLPLFPGDFFEVPIARLVETVIRQEDCLNDPLILSDCDHRQIFDIQIDPDCHQMRIFFPLFDPLGLNMLHLREVQSRALLAQDQFGTLVLPSWITPARLEVATQFDRIVVPFPTSSCVDLEAGKACAWGVTQVRRVQVQAERFVVEGRMIARSWAPRSPLFLA